MKTFLKPLFVFVIPGIFLISSCKKDSQDVKPVTKSNDSTVFYTSIDNDMNSVDAIIDEVLEENSNFRTAAGCYTVSFSADTTSPVPGYETNFRKFTLTFTGTCDSLQRTGQIIVFKSGSWLTGNYKDSAIFSGYSTDGRAISGYRSRSFSTSSDLKNLVFDFSHNITITTSAGKTIIHKSSGKKTIVNYLLPLLRRIEVTGQGVYIHANGNEVSFTISKAIVLNGACARKYRFPVEGVITYNNTKENFTSTVNFGDGNCDRLATISINGAAAVTFKMK